MENILFSAQIGCVSSTSIHSNYLNHPEIDIESHNLLVKKPIRYLISQICKLDDKHHTLAASCHLSNDPAHKKFSKGLGPVTDKHSSIFIMGIVICRSTSDTLYVSYKILIYN